MLVDSSVWIDFFNGRMTRETEFLRIAQAERLLMTGDLILTEVLQGFRNDRALEWAREILLDLDLLTIGGQNVALQAAYNFRHLRSKGVTVRKTIDTLIATRCIMDGIELLYRDRDFDPFVEHLGLISALEPKSGTN